MDQFNLLNSMVSQTRKMWTEQMMKIFILHRGSWQRDNVFDGYVSTSFHANRILIIVIFDGN